MSDPIEIPPEIAEAAQTLSVWFTMHGSKTWELMDVCSRNHADKEKIREVALRDIKAVFTRWYREEMNAEEAILKMENIAVGVWTREAEPNYAIHQLRRKIE